MVNHTIHTCEQRVRFPLSAIVILFTILPLFSILHHTYTNLPISIHQTQTKNHITISLYNISVSILHTHSYKKTKTISSSSLTILTTTSYQIYIYYLTYYSSLLLYIYQLTIKIHHYLRQIYILHLTYTIITYLLTLKIEPTYLFTYFIIQLYEYTYPYFHTVYTIPYHYYFIITTLSYSEHTICICTYIYTYIQSYIQSYTIIHTIISIDYYSHIYINNIQHIIYIYIIYANTYISYYSLSLHLRHRSILLLDIMNNSHQQTIFHVLLNTMNSIMLYICTHISCTYVYYIMYICMCV